jgi:hypothetical protein
LKNGGPTTPVTSEATLPRTLAKLRLAGVWAMASAFGSPALCDHFKERQRPIFVEILTNS